MAATIFSIDSSGLLAAAFFVLVLREDFSFGGFGSGEADVVAEGGIVSANGASFTANLVDGAGNLVICAALVFRASLMALMFIKSDPFCLKKVWLLGYAQTLIMSFSRMLIKFGSPMMT